MPTCSSISSPRVYSGTDGLIGRLAHLMAGTARSRVLYELLIECRRFGQPRGMGAAVALSESDLVLAVCGYRGSSHTTL